MTPMPLPRFERLLDARGPALGAWPARDRAAAAALLAASPEAARLLAEARALEVLLREGMPRPAPEAVARLRAATARAVARRPLPRTVRPELRPWLSAGCAALATVAVAVLWLGTASPAPRAEGPLAMLQALPVAGEPL